MYIPDWLRNIIIDDTIFHTLLLLLIGIISFGLGRWSVSNQLLEQQLASVATVQQIKKGNEKNSNEKNYLQTKSTSLTTLGQFVGSKNGSKYHFPWCPGAGQMKEENKIWFINKTEAENAGYTPASNCSGI